MLVGRLFHRGPPGANAQGPMFEHSPRGGERGARIMYDTPAPGAPGYRHPFFHGSLVATKTAGVDLCSNLGIR